MELCGRFKVYFNVLFIITFFLEALLGSCDFGKLRCVNRAIWDMATRFLLFIFFTVFFDILIISAMRAS